MAALRHLLLALFLAAGVAVLSAQSNAGLRIVVVEGEGAVNIVQQKTATAPVVEVRDRNNQPVAGAIVRFAIRNGRATFGGARNISVATNAAGRAVATGQANDYQQQNADSWTGDDQLQHDASPMTADGESWIRLCVSPDDEGSSGVAGLRGGFARPAAQRARAMTAR